MSNLITADRDIGAVRELTINGGTPKQNSKVIANMRSNSKIPEAEGAWEAIDAEVLRAYEEEAKFIEDLRGQGLTTNVDIGDLFSSYRISSLMNNANADMSGLGEGSEDRIDYKTRTVPVPVVHKEFRIPWRELDQNDVSADNIAEATRAVTRMLESIAWGGTDWTIEGNSINGLEDTGTNGNWGAEGAWTTASNAYAEIKHGLETLIDNGYSSPFNLYVDNAYMSDLYTLRSNTTMNYVELIEKLPDIGKVVFSDNVPDNEAYLVSMTRRSFDIAVAQWITSANWKMDNQGRVTQYSVFCVCVPRMKKDYAGNEGVNRNTDISS